MIMVLVFSFCAALGAIIRHVLDSFLGMRGILIANVLGSIIAGAITAAGIVTNLFTEEAQFALLAGFAGALTTFSTVSVRSANWVSQRQFLKATAVWIVHLGTSIAAALCAFATVLIALGS